jgi:hypothetical protein
MCVGNRVCGFEFHLYIPHIKMFEKCYILMKLARSKILYAGRQNLCELMNRWISSVQNRFYILKL